MALNKAHDSAGPDMKNGSASAARSNAEHKEAPAGASRNSKPSKAKQNAPSPHGQRVVQLVPNIRKLQSDSPYASNMVRTSRYTLLTFLPVNLFEQLSQLQNFYFLFIGALQIIRPISTSDGVPNMYVPLAFILFVSGLRAAIEDYQRHEVDERESSRLYSVFRGIDKTEQSPKARSSNPTVIEVKPKDKVERSMSMARSPARAPGFELIKSAHIVVGDIVRVNDNQPIPADLLLLRSSNVHGHCFVETSSLDGETDLKPKMAVSGTHEALKTSADLMALEGTIRYEPPNKKLDEFRCQIKSKAIDDNEWVGLVAENLLLRGTVIKNTEYVIGVAVYTGDDTKIRCNVKQIRRLKNSTLMKQVDKGIIYMLILQSVLCFIAAVLSANFHSEHQHNHSWYLHLEGTAGLEGTKRFFTWFIILSQLVPISLLVSSEIVKTFQAFFINRDVKLYDPTTDTPALVRVSQLNEDLGQIQAIFTDKTGTLTQNRMELRVALVPLKDAPHDNPRGHRCFGDPETEISKRVKALKAKAVQKEPMTPTQSRVLMGSSWTGFVSELEKQQEEELKRGGDVKVKFAGEQAYLDLLWEGKDYDSLLASPETNNKRPDRLNVLEEKASDGGQWTKQEHRDMMRRFLTHMALSNTINPIWDDKTQSYVFQASSPDELALCQFGHAMGFSLTARNPTVLKIDKRGRGEAEELQYRHLATLGFNSKRKRVTMIYEKDGKVELMMKGADSSMIPLLTDLKDQTPKLHALEEELVGMARNGLRTLLLAFADKDLSWWKEWRPLYEEVSQMPEAGDEANHQKGACSDHCRICDALERIERAAEMKLLGATAIEDRLQDLVPESIEDYLSAGVRVWMLTGDKRETAKNIGMACNLIDPDMEHSDWKKTRLIEVTGSWSQTIDNREDLRVLFDAFDTNHDGAIDREELSSYLATLDFPFLSLGMGDMSESDDLGAGDHKLHGPTPSTVDRLFRLADQNNDNAIDFDEFVALLRSVNLSMYEAVETDILSGLETLARFQGKKPMSMIVEGSAFAALYPPTVEVALETEHSISKRRRSVEMVADRCSLELRDQRGISNRERARLRDKFFDLAAEMKSVVCCRLTPFQKAKIVQEMKARRNLVTLAIGDGANDEAMILEADVGVGITGLEGTAASRAASYAISQFRFLHTLLFVHGYWSYRRISKLVLYIFYKAIMVVMVMFYFGFSSGFSGQQFVNDFIFQWYNVLFTAAPIICLAVLDQGLSRETLENSPVAYGSIIPRERGNGLFFNSRIFGEWVVRALFHACIIYLVCHFGVGLNTISNSNGQTHGIWIFSTTAYSCVVILATFRVVLEFVTITAIHQFFVWISFGGYFLVLWAITLPKDFNPDMSGVVARMYATGTSWLTILLAVAMPLLIDFCILAAQREFVPTVPMVLQERQRLTEAERRRLPELKLAATLEMERRQKQQASEDLTSDAADMMMALPKMTESNGEEFAQKESKLQAGHRMETMMNHVMRKAAMSSSVFIQNGRTSNLMLAHDSMPNGSDHAHGERLSPRSVSENE